MSPTPFRNRLSLSAQCLTVLLFGLMAGFFATYSANVNFATLELDGPTYAQMQSAFNRNVRHAGFFACFFGPVPLGLLTLAAAWAERRTAWWRLLALAVFAYALGIVLFTRQVNLPLNALTESWTPATLPADWARVRDAWNRANLWRTALSLVLFAAGLLTLVLRLPLRPLGHEWFAALVFDMSPSHRDHARPHHPAGAEPRRGVAGAGQKPGILGKR